MSTTDDKIAELRERAAVLGAIDETYPHPVSEARLIVLDDAIDNIERYRVDALAQTFESVTIGHATFHGIGKKTSEQLPLLIASQYPKAISTLTFFRKSPEDQSEPNFLHTDRDMGDWSGILYLTSKPASGDGTTFWRNKWTGAHASTALTHSELLCEWLSWREMSNWEPWTTVEAKLNRLVLFSSTLFHSRALRENYGHGDDARLIQLVFGRGDLS